MWLVAIGVVDERSRMCLAEEAYVGDGEVMPVGGVWSGCAGIVRHIRRIWLRKQSSG
jgi:hypothetical protein